MFAQLLELLFILFYHFFFFVSPALRLFNTLLPQRISLRCFPRATSRAVSAGPGKPCWRGAAKPGTSPPRRPDPVQRSGLNHPRRPGKPGQAAWRLASPKSLPETRGKSCWSRGAVSRQWRRSGHRPWGAHPKILPAFLQSHEKQGSAFQLCSFPPHHCAVDAATSGGKKGGCKQGRIGGVHPKNQHGTKRKPVVATPEQPGRRQASPLPSALPQPRGDLLRRKGKVSVPAAFRGKASASQPRQSCASSL